ncbi:MAG: DUF4340 domain-containing protein [Anaerolineales bacterium]|nr:DUF4340 domain-containing protein [Anaerolineales bacterium]
MKPRYTLIVVAVAVALIVYAFWVESPLTSEQLSTRQGTPAATLAPYIFQLNAADVKTITITDLRFPRVVTVTRTESGWRVTSPENKPADNTKVEATAAALTSLKLVRTIKATDLASFGLAPARLDARVIMKDGAAYGILLGNATPDGSLYYATYTGETTNVFLIETSLGLSLQNLLDIPPFEPTATPTWTPTPAVTPTAGATPASPGFVPTWLPAPVATPKP